MNSKPHILAVELEVRGHHADYVKTFADTWNQANLPVRLDFLVNRRFQEFHQNVVEYVTSLNPNCVTIELLSAQDQSRLERNRRLKYWHGWKIFREQAMQRSSAHGLLMYSDYFQLPAVVGPALPCGFSSVYFRPTFHYRNFANFSPSLKQRFTAWRKELLLRRFLRIPQLKELYCLDPLVVPYIQKNFSTAARISHIADTFSPSPVDSVRVNQLKQELGIESGRVVFNLLGVLDSRKGPKQLLQSIEHIKPEIGKQICILLLGYIPHDDPEGIEELATAQSGKNGVQVILRNAYIDPSEVQNYYALSDVILTTYQYHMGSSSAIVRACLARKPILSSDYGLMGELVRQRQLGTTVDSSSPHCIAEGMELMVRDRYQLSSFLNEAAAADLVRENSREQLSNDLQRLIDFCPYESHGTRQVPRQTSASQMVGF